MGVRLVLLRHGESEWNLANRFTGWTDVALSERGIQEAHRAGHLLRAAGYIFDKAHTSVLKRAIQTLWISTEELDMMWLPVYRSWRLYERHYGALQGLVRKKTAEGMGAARVHRWRRSYDVRLPALSLDEERHARFDPRYAHLESRELPATESLKDTLDRVLPYWREVSASALKRGRRVLVSAYGNSLRVLIKYLDDISDRDIPTLNIPTGFPLGCELDDDLEPIRKAYLGDPQAANMAAQAVADQAALGR